jgi:hypothetical protein
MPNPDENFLTQVVCIIMVDYHFPNQPVDTLLIFSHQKIESHLPSLFCLEFFENFFVFLIQIEIVSGL